LQYQTYQEYCSKNGFLVLSGQRWGIKMQPNATEAPSRSVARFNGKGRRQPKMRGEGARGDNVGAVKPRIAKQGYARFLSLRDLDGRSRAAARCRELVASLESDLGGSDRLSTAQRQLVQRAALLATQLEDFEVRWSLGEPIELQDYLATVNCQRRVLQSLGLERRARDVTPTSTLAEYLASRAPASAAKPAGTPA
jgi:hypothetical protein